MKSSMMIEKSIERKIDEEDTETVSQVYLVNGRIYYDIFINPSDTNDSYRCSPSDIQFH